VEEDSEPDNGDVGAARASNIHTAIRIMLKGKQVRGGTHEHLKKTLYKANTRAIGPHPAFAAE